MAKNESIKVDFMDDEEPDKVQVFRVKFKGYIDVSAMYMTSDGGYPEEGITVKDAAEFFGKMTKAEWAEWLNQFDDSDKLEVNVKELDEAEGD